MRRYNVQYMPVQCSVYTINFFLMMPFITGTSDPETKMEDSVSYRMARCEQPRNLTTT